MKFSIDKERFLTALGIAVRGASTRSAIQTLAGVMVRAETGSVELQATDMELGVRIRLEVDPEREGAAVVPATEVTPDCRQACVGELPCEVHGDLASECYRGTPVMGQ